MKNDFIKATSIRAIKTIAQTLLSMITVGQALSDIDWLTCISVSLVAGICSILTSIVTGLPEVETNGELILEKNDEGIPQFRLSANDLKDGMKITVRDDIGDT